MLKLSHRQNFRGDTLIEVTLAIGIFSMVAVAAVSILTASVSSLQTVLENTLTREEIDAQAEALRFIQSAYSAEGEEDPDNPTKYSALWDHIANRAINLNDLPNAPDGSESELKKTILNYNPTTCNELYLNSNDSNDVSLIKQKAFLINTHNLGLTLEDFYNPEDYLVNQRQAKRKEAINTLINKIIIEPEEPTNTQDKDNPILKAVSNSNTEFKPATTYPLINYNSDNDITSAEGIFIVPVKDSDGTVIITNSVDDKYALKDASGNPIQPYEDEPLSRLVSAYIDFYIRSCFFTTNSEHPSTISTVIRLYNPNVISSSKDSRKTVIIEYDKNAEDATGSMPNQYIRTNTSSELSTNQFARLGYEFLGWDYKCDGIYNVGYNINFDYANGARYDVPSNIANGDRVRMCAVWEKRETTFAAAFSNAGKTQKNGYYKMQDINSEICSAVINEQEIQLIDDRDDKV